MACSALKTDSGFVSPPIQQIKPASHVNKLLVNAPRAMLNNVGNERQAQAKIEGMLGAGSGQNWRERVKS